MESIGDARGFSVETLTGATPSWKNELNRSISAVEDGISGGLQHRHEMCCKKDGRCGRQACMVQRWFHHRDVVSGLVDLYMTVMKPEIFDKVPSNICGLATSVLITAIVAPPPTSLSTSAWS